MTTTPVPTPTPEITSVVPVPGPPPVSTVTVNFPPEVVDRLTPHGSGLSQPWATVLAACIAVVAALIAFYGVRWRAKKDAKQAKLDRDAEADRAAADRKAAIEQARRAERTNVVTRVVDVTQALMMSTSQLVAARLADADADVMAEENEVGEKASETLLFRDLLLLWASPEAG